MCNWNAITMSLTWFTILGRHRRDLDLPSFPSPFSQAPLILDVPPNKRP